MIKEYKLKECKVIKNDFYDEKYEIKEGKKTLARIYYLSDSVFSLGRKKFKLEFGGMQTSCKSLDECLRVFKETYYNSTDAIITWYIPK